MKTNRQNIQPNSAPSKYFKFRILGSGPTLLILGGSSTDWENTLELLASNFKLVVPTFSKSVLDRQNGGDDPVLYLEKLLDELDIDKFSILGHSVSTWIGLRLAAKHPKRVEKLILANLPNKIEDKQSFLRLHQELIGKKGILKPTLSAFWYDRSFYGLDFLEEVKDVLEATPFLVVTGETDRFFSEEKLAAWSSEQSNLNLEVIRFAGHFSMKDNPWYFSAIVKEFLQNHSFRTQKSKSA
jgi:pimeloyl-ACP methyl ester carboxylesterase